MTEQQDFDEQLEREEISARIANFKATQEKFQREREAYYATTMEAARASGVEQIRRQRVASLSGHLLLSQAETSSAL